MKEADGELTDYKYHQEQELIDANREDYDAGRVHFRYDDAKGRWRKLVNQ